MKLSAISQAVKDIKADALIVFTYEIGKDKKITEEVKAVNGHIPSEIGKTIANGDYKAGLNDICMVYPSGKATIKRIFFAGLGKKEEMTADKLRRASGSAFGRVAGSRSKTAAVIFPNIKKLTVEETAQIITEGALLATYKFDIYKSKDKKDKEPKVELESAQIIAGGSEVRRVQSGINRGTIISKAVNFARNLINQPGSAMTPAIFADTARLMAQDNKIKCEIWNEKKIQQMKMGSFYGVAKGAVNPPRFVVLEYKHGKNRPVVIVGKGITFDSGGLNIKTGGFMADMKSDMSGAAAVVATMQAVAQLKLPVNIIALAPLCENIPSGTAVKPGDILQAMNGKTIEIDNTDAEGRLILADALCYASKYKPSAVIDLATLTGACVRALGENLAAGLFSSDEKLTEDLKKASEKSAERVWEFPMWDDYKEGLKSNIADVINCGGTGLSPAAMFLKEFTDYPWVHLDIAPMALSKGGGPYQPKGAIGYGVRMLVEYLQARV